jgi:hypothetical protein
MVSNRVSGELSVESKKAILDAFDTALSELSFAIDLTVDERKKLSKMGDSSWGFIERAHNLVLRNPDFLPRSFDTTAMTEHMELYREMHGVMQAAKQMYERIEDTYKALGADIFSEALAVYNYAKMSDPGLAMDEVLKDMARRFSRKGRPFSTNESDAMPDIQDVDLIGMQEAE